MTGEGNHMGVSVQLTHDINTMTNNISAAVSAELAQEINERLLRQVCAQLFGTSDVQMVQDVFDIVLHDPNVLEKVIARRAARRMGVK
jgi:hypothetical protein